MKPTSNFKMSKSTKRMLDSSRFKSPGQKSNFRKLMIEAQLYSQVIVKPGKSSESDTA